MTDDQDTSIAVMKRLQTRLVARGMTFTNAYVTTSLCCPSRISFLRGQYAHNHGVLENRPPQGGWARAQALGLEQSTLPVWLQQAGYTTAYFGKYLNGYDWKQTATIPGWSHWMGTRYGYFVPFNVDGQIKRFGPDGDMAAYTTDIIARFGSEYIGTVPEPFFVMLAPYAPHAKTAGTAPIPATRHAGRFAGVPLPQSPSFNEADVSDKPPVGQAKPLTAAQVAQLTTVYQKRQESLLAVDELVGKILSVLDTTGRLVRTYVIFTSDNGFHLGEHRRTQGKNQPYEEDVRVPLIIRGPGIPHGVTTTALALNIDLAPTIAELAGVTPPSWVDGRSLAALWTGGAWSRIRFATEHYNPATRWYTQGVHTGTDALHEWRRDSVIEYEYYDLVNDPYQLVNAFNGLATFPTQLEDLRALEACAGASCRVADSHR